MSRENEGSSLRISTEVIEKISCIAATEIDGVSEISLGTTAVKDLLNKSKFQKAVNVKLTDGIAEITICVIVKNGYKVPNICEKIQNNIKDSVQNMTNINVSKVNVEVTGVVVDGVGED